jgi:hypothetical protein
MLAPPYRLDLGKLRLVVMDTANSCDQHTNFPAEFTRQLDELETLTTGGDRAWVVSHRPIWGVDWLNQDIFQTSNVNLQQSLRRSDRAACPPRWTWCCPALSIGSSR